MKKSFSWTVTFSLILLSASALAYTVHYVIFRDAHHIFIYMIGDIAFLFMDVLLTILLIERLLSHRDKLNKLKKLNMVIGTFFSEVGLELLSHFSQFVKDCDQLTKNLEINPDWGNRDFIKAVKSAQDFSYQIHINREDLPRLRDFLTEKRAFLLRLLENPNLLEHDRFTDLLWAVFHLTEELHLRGERLTDLPEPDYKHLAIDLKRAYAQLTSAWLSYTMHLKQSYPFLFSLAARINPLNPQSTPIISE